MGPTGYYFDADSCYDEVHSSNKVLSNALATAKNVFVQNYTRRFQ